MNDYCIARAIVLSLMAINLSYHSYEIAREVGMNGKRLSMVAVCLVVTIHIIGIFFIILYQPDVNSVHEKLSCSAQRGSPAACYKTGGISSFCSPDQQGSVCVL